MEVVGAHILLGILLVFCLLIVLFYYQPSTPTPLPEPPIAPEPAMSNVPEFEMSNAPEPEMSNAPNEITTYTPPESVYEPPPPEEPVPQPTLPIPTPVYQPPPVTTQDVYIPPTQDTPLPPPAEIVPPVPTPSVASYAAPSDFQQPEIRDLTQMPNLQTDLSQQYNQVISTNVPATDSNITYTDSNALEPNTSFPAVTATLNFPSMNWPTMMQPAPIGGDAGWYAEDSAFGAGLYGPASLSELSYDTTKVALPYLTDTELTTLKDELVPIHQSVKNSNACKSYGDSNPSDSMDQLLAATSQTGNVVDQLVSASGGVPGDLAQATPTGVGGATDGGTDVASASSGSAGVEPFLNYIAKQFRSLL